jgi:hypothetical protein
MRRIDELMKELGFNKEAPESIQKAFIQHLIKVANESEKAAVHTEQQNLLTCKTLPGEQLSFDIENDQTKVQRKTAA